MLRKLIIVVAVLAVAAALLFLGRGIYRNAVERRDAEERAASPQGQLPEAVEPLSYELSLRIDPTVESFSGRSRITIRIHQPTDVIWLHGEDIRAESASLTTADGRVLDLDYHEMGHSGVVRLAVGETLAAQDATVTIDYSAPFGTRLEGLYRASDGDQSWAFSQFAPFSARLAFPGFDEPRFKTPFDLAVEARASHVAATTTPAISEERLADGFRRVRFATTKPLPTYLLAFAVGDLEIVEWEPVPANELRREPLPLRGLARRGRGEELRFALGNTAAFVAALEDYFAAPFPFSKLDLVAVPEFTSGAMENVGLIMYQERFLLLGDEPPVSSVRRYAEIHAHELAHMWHGNLVTMPWWNDVWLNESFATWLGNKIAGAWDPALGLARSTVRDSHAVMADDSYVSARSVREPIRSNDDILNAFDDISYAKGGGVLHMFESFLGEERFRDGVRRHIQRFPFGHARAEDFIESLMQAGAEPGIDTAFLSFLEQPGVPLLTVDWRCGEGGVEIDLEPSRYLPVGSRGSSRETWAIPACVRLAGNGTERKHCELLEAKAERLELPAETCPVVVMPNAEAAGYYRWSLPPEGWRSLLDHLDLLTASERYSVIDNLAAELRAGRIDPGFYLAAVAPFAAMEEWDLVLAPLDELTFIVDHLVEEDERRPLRDHLNGLYAPVLDRIGWQAPAGAAPEPPSQSLLREELVRFLAFTTRDPELRRTLLDLGRAHIGYQAAGETAAESVHDELVRPALGVALQELGRPYYEALMERFEASEDPVFRERVLIELGRITDPELSEEIRDKLMSFSLGFSEKRAIFAGQLLEPENRQAMFEWLESAWKTLGLFVPDSVLANLTVVADDFCTPELHAAARQFFEPRLAEVTGGRRAAQQMLEKIELCTALVERHRDSGPASPGP